MSVFLFPGQGSQKPGMGLDLYEQSPAARAVFDQLAPACPSGFLDIIFRGAQETLNDTRTAQPALYITEIAVARHLEALGLSPTCCAGHSLGEIPALVIAGVLDVESGLTLIRERAAAMSENVPEGGMAAVLGLEADAIERALPAGVQVANYNGPTQTIITGTLSGLAQAETALKDAGAKRVIPLQVSGPFHSEYMRPAAARLCPLVALLAFSAPCARFVSSISGKEESDPEYIRQLLMEQLYSPVRWTQVMAAIGPVPALEAGPGNTLKGLAKRTEGAPNVDCAGTFEEARAAVASGKGETHGSV